MKIVYDNKFEYIPEWNGNRQDPEPAKFYCRLLTTAERKRAISSEILSEEGRTYVRLKTDEELLIRLSIERIENLSAGTGQKLETGRDLIGIPVPEALWSELVGEILEHNREPSGEEIKN